MDKIDDTREKVEKMSVELEEAKTQVAAYQKQCDEFLKTLVQQKREADEAQKVCDWLSKHLNVSVIIFNKMLFWI